MSDASLLLVGAGGHAKACLDVIEAEGRFRVAGLVGLQAEVGGQLLGYPIMGSDVDLPALVSRHPDALLGVGQIRSAALRTRLFEELLAHGFRLPVIVSPLAHVSRHARIGAGTIIMHGAIINSGAVIGRNCIINSQALIEHDTVIADHCHVSTAAVVNGAVTVGTGSFIGSNATVREAVRIGEHCVIGMGERVYTDCPSGTAPLPRGTAVTP
jgi:sugar O-acyltransferase (sialic acid O-acetyltransferase NeuD family)